MKIYTGNDKLGEEFAITSQLRLYRHVLEINNQDFNVFYGHKSSATVSLYSHIELDSLYSLLLFFYVMASGGLHWNWNWKLTVWKDIFISMQLACDNWYLLPFVFCYCMRGSSKQLDK